MTRKSVTSKDNPTYKGLVKLSRSRRERTRRGVTLLDGVRLVDAYLRNGGKPELIVVRDDEFAGKRARELVEEYPHGNPLLLADGLFAALSTVKTPGGILAVVPIPAEGAAGGEGDILLLEEI